MTGIEAASGSLANPFVGPRPIEKGQQIFGRDPEIDQLYYLLSAERIVLFYSPSGAGKSSLIQAGLIPRLAPQFDVWAPVRVNLSLQANGPANINRYARSCNLGFEAEIPKELQRPEDAIAPITLVEYVAARPRRRSAARNVVLIFDQFEEVLTVDPLALDAKREFFGQLGKLLQDPQLWAIFAIREDYLAALDPYAELLPSHLKNRFRLDMLSRAAAEEAIRKPVEAGGRSFAPQALGRLVADLAMMQVQQPGGEFKSEPGPFIEPLHLQVACRSLWEKMTPDRKVIEDSDIDSFGDVTRALAEYYETEITKSADGNERIERSIREWCGGMLITRGNIRGQVLREAGQSGGLDNRLIERLVDTHLVRGEQRAGATWYELAHDRLVEPILRNNELWFTAHLNKFQQRALQWEREGDPESLLITGAELAVAQRWAALPAKDLTEGERRFLAACHKKRRRLLQVRAAAAILFVLLIVTSALGLIARRERNRAEMNLQLAKQAVDESLSSAGRQQAREFPDPPEMEAFRRVLLEKAAAFYAVFTSENSGNLKLREEAAWAHSRLGDVNRLLERRDEAVKEYKQAIASFQALAAQYPDVTKYRRALAYCHNWLGETIWSERSSARMGLEQAETPDPTILSEARKEYDEALRLQQHIHDSDPANTDNTQELARSYYNRGILLTDRGDRQGAESDFRAAIALLEPFANRPAAQDNKQPSPVPAQELARVYNNLATLVEDEGRSEEAKALYEQAIQIAGQLATRSPQERENQAELALYCDNEARLLVDMHDLAAAQRRNQQSLDIVEALANPAPALSQEQANILQLRSEILLAQGSPDALDASERERELLERLERGETFQRLPLLRGLYKNLAVNYIELVTKELQDGDLPGAQLSLKSLARVLPQLTAEDKATAQDNYRELQNDLQLKLSGRN
jgi:tetratricopeptide (TPR) repeat protein